MAPFVTRLSHRAPRVSKGQPGGLGSSARQEERVGIKTTGTRVAEGRAGSCAHRGKTRSHGSAFTKTIPDGGVLEVELRPDSPDLKPRKFLAKDGDLVYRDHGREFWSMLGRVMPDYEGRKRWLGELGPGLVW